MLNNSSIIFCVINSTTTTTTTTTAALIWSLSSHFSCLLNVFPLKIICFLFYYISSLSLFICGIEIKKKNLFLLLFDYVLEKHLSSHHKKKFKAATTTSIKNKNKIKRNRKNWQFLTQYMDDNNNNNNIQTNEIS